ncbi:Coenzyme A disulfide reductase [uncultured Clostridium sp.]|uniref:CoA-disulfide reductase n=1 Tax=uncultured Clostridium sp. TaxID=59620 RepID=UPI000821A195|nr:CoA-disulfide reductase [uncultured Clostridium sp.]SCJ97608.1 Coenzyme A disulfide reductase [uncultured Clostridium sp.]
MSKKVLIVGGVAGGASTAARLRRINEEAKIIMFEKGEYISFANCGLPYYIGGTINDRSKLIVQTVEAMEDKFNMDIRNFSEVTKINRDNKTVEVKNAKTGEVYEESYDILVLSPGANPIKPPIPGIKECDNLFTLRNIPDTDAIKAHVDNTNPKSAVVIGGGFIGLEMAENLVDRGVNVTLVEMANQVMAPIDYEMACIVHEHLLYKGVNLILEDGVNSFLNNGKKVKLNSGKEIDSDLLILSIGVAPESKIARDAGLEVNKRKAIVVDERMKTSDDSIYALGDAVEVKDFVTGVPTMAPLAWPANRQGRIVADNIAGRNAKYNGTLGSSVAKVFDLTVAATGNNEKSLKAKSVEYKAIHIHPGSHAGYYPGAFPISLKLIFSPKDGKILGAQAVGIDGVEKIIDVLATAIKGSLTVFDLPDLELCYAPPYSSAKDPVNMVGYYATNLLEGLVDIVQWNEIDELKANNEFILDVREPFEISLGTIEGSVNIPLGEIRKRINELPKNKTIYVYCQVGQRGYVACRLLSQLGYKCVNIDGGYKTYALTRGINEDNIPAVVNQILNDNGVIDNMTPDLAKVSVTLDACGLQCPGPIRRVFEEMQNLKEGDVIEVRATDPGFSKDIASWCKNTGNTMIKSEFDKSKKAFVAYVQKGMVCCPSQTGTIADAALATQVKNGSTMVVFSGDLDKAIASFIIATGAASMGKEVTMFFTFWGLNILKRKEKPKVKKNIIEKMFDFMLPSNTEKLPLSKMNMGGMGPKMIKHIMKTNNVDSLDMLIENAIKMNVKVVACAMSMDLMGIKKEELIDGVEVAGVASYLGAADESGLNLFI